MRSDPLQRLAGRRVLVVEDEPLIAMEIEVALEDFGAIVVGPAMRLAEAMDLFDDTSVDVAILDIDLHGQEVFPLAERLRAAKVPFLFHTSHAAHDTLRDRFSRIPVCRKPMSTEVLVAETAGLL